MDPIAQKYVFDLLSTHFNINSDKLTLETQIIEDLGADQLDIFEIIFDLETEFEIIVSDVMMEKNNTIENLIEQITLDHQVQNRKGK